MKERKLHVAEVYFDAFAYRGYSRVRLARCHSYEEAVAVCNNDTLDGYHAYNDYHINKVYNVGYMKSKDRHEVIVAVFVSLPCYGKELRFKERGY